MFSPTPLDSLTDWDWIFGWQIAIPVKKGFLPIIMIKMDLMFWLMGRLEIQAMSRSVLAIIRLMRLGDCRPTS